MVVCLVSLLHFPFANSADVFSRLLPVCLASWLPDGYSKIFRSYVFGPSGFWTMSPLRCAAKFDPFLSLDFAPALHPGPTRGKEGIKFCHLATLVSCTAVLPSSFIPSCPILCSIAVCLLPLQVHHHPDAGGPGEGGQRRHRRHRRGGRPHRPADAEGHQGAQAAQARLRSAQ